MKNLPFDTGEANRLEELNRYENELYAMGYSLIAGMDEAGRGPLAGPVVACCLVLPKNARLVGVNDSKKLSPKKRCGLYADIVATALDIGIGVIDAASIDEINILHATYKAMHNAIGALMKPPEAIIVDGRPIPGFPPTIYQMPVVKGDQLSMTVAAASIVAKVTRDEMMLNFHKQYPMYGFDKHKGYGTAYHIDAIKKNGLSPLHRVSFAQKFVNEGGV